VGCDVTIFIFGEQGWHIDSVWVVALSELEAGCLCKPSYKLGASANLNGEGA